MIEITKENWQGIHIFGFIMAVTGLLWVVAGEIITTTQDVWNIFR